MPILASREDPTAFGRPSLVEANSRRNSSLASYTYAPSFVDGLIERRRCVQNSLFDCLDTLWRFVPGNMAVVERIAPYLSDAGVVSLDRALEHINQPF